MSDKKITVLVVEPLKESYTKEICGLKEMQQVVGGSIEAVYPFDEPVAVVVNEEGKLLDLPFNRPVLDDSGLPSDVICGTFFVAGVGRYDFVSLKDQQIRKYKEYYDNLMLIPAEKQRDSSKKKGNKPHER